MINTLLMERVRLNARQYRLIPADTGSSGSRSAELFQHMLLAFIALVSLNTFVVFLGYAFVCLMMLKGVGLWASIALVTGMLFSFACLAVGILMNQWETHTEVPSL